MNLNAKPLLNGLSQLFGSKGRILGSLLHHKIHYFAGQLVPSLRTAFVRQQAEHTVLLKCRLRLVEGGARESESVRGFADGLLIYVNLAEHLVLDLQQVVGIEEIAVSGCGLSVPCRRRVWRFCWRSGGEVMLRITCKYNYVQVRPVVKLFLRPRRYETGILYTKNSQQTTCFDKATRQDSPYNHDVISFTCRARRPFSN